MKDLDVDESMKNDDFLDKVKNQEKRPAESEQTTNEAFDKVKEAKIKRRQELELEKNLAENNNKQKQEPSGPDEFEAKLIENQPKERELDAHEESAAIFGRITTEMKAEGKEPPEFELKPEAVEEQAPAEKIEKPAEPAAEPEKPKAESQVEVLTPEQAVAITKSEETLQSIGKEVPAEDFEETIRATHAEIINENYRQYGDPDLESDSNLTSEEVIDVISDSYEETTSSDTDKPVEVVNEETVDEKRYMDKPVVREEPENTDENRRKWHGGDGETSSFKSYSAKASKILRNINVEDTSTIRGVDLTGKTQKERHEFYLKNVLPTMQPNFSVVPFVISGVVVSMSAFGWNDLDEICKIDEKLQELEPSDPDYTYEKNQIFIERREKQLDLFYKHIIRISGYNEVPEKEVVYGDILKFPDFQQLFFAAYAATFPKDYNFTINCGSCGFENTLTAKPKDLCFLLNKNINIDQLNKYISKGGSFNNSVTAEVYNEFQKEELVQQCNKIFRTKKVLSDSAFIYELKIPTISEAVESMKEIADLFRDKPFEHIDKDGNVYSIDSSFGLPNYLIDLRKYMYLKHVLVAQAINEDKASGKVRVNYTTLPDTNTVIGSMYNLSSGDYRELMRDPQLNNLVKCMGIQHALKAGKCKAEMCQNDMGIIPVDPESLFFQIAQSDSNN